MKKLVTVGALSVAMLMPAVARADNPLEDLLGKITRHVESRIDDVRDLGRHDDRQDDRHEDRHDDHRDSRYGGRDDVARQPVWVEGHYESRDVSRVVPAVVRQEWVPDRCEEVCIPAVTERVCVPAVTERVWVPAVSERVYVPGRYEVRRDARGCEVRVWVGAHYEERVVRAGCYETRVVKPECWETRVVVPERRETRVVERGHYQNVVVRPERVETVCDRVWVAGHWASRPAWRS